MDIADYLKQGGQTAGHRELWRLLKTMFKQDNDADRVIEQPLPFRRPLRHLQHHAPSLRFRALFDFVLDLFNQASRIGPVNFEG